MELDFILFNILSNNSPPKHSSIIKYNELSDSYVVGMDFTRGRLHTPSVCEWKDGRLVEK